MGLEAHCWELSHNKLREISANTFSGLNGLQTLLLQYNQLTHASEEIFIHLPLLTFLRIHGNPWSCDCALREIIWWLQLPGNHQMGLYATCSSPEHIVGTTLKQVQINSLCENKVLPVYNHESVAGITLVCCLNSGQYLLNKFTQ
uniref:LRRCT domain-containing protein n=1 Tax=Eptatretus burgeri TaxID=7764 RepID=A0A8C4QH88_EPTBU